MASINRVGRARPLARVCRLDQDKHLTALFPLKGSGLLTGIAVGEGEAPVANANLDLVRLQARRHQHPASDLALLGQGALKGLPGIPGRPTFPDISACQLQEQGERHHMA